MKRIILTLLAITIITSACGEFVESAQAKYSGGTGEPNDPYQIATPEDLNDIGNHPEDFNKCFIQTADINLAQFTGTRFKIIGPNTTTSFNGVFDGNGRKVWSFTWDSNGRSGIGLFGYVGQGGQIKNLGLEDVDVNTGSSGHVGGLCGENYGTISACYATGNVSHGSGLCGENHGTISDCNATCSVSGGSLIGGLCGWSHPPATIRGCFATGAVTGSGSVGGLCGVSNGTISDCYATGNVSGVSFVGGLCGASYGTISDCYATGNVSGSGGLFVGGLCGESSHGTISGCYATGAVTGGSYLGGLCGRNYDFAMITDCYATGTVTGGSYLGGLCGRNYDFAMITDCYATGAITGGDNSQYLGGLCGYNDSGTISDSYATGAVTGGDDSNFLGGLCGSNHWNSTGGTITACYATGYVTGGDDSNFLGGLCGANNSSTISASYATGTVTSGGNSQYLGGLCGGNFGFYAWTNRCYATGKVIGHYYIGGLCGSNEGAITASFWDIETSDCNKSAGGIGMTTAQMKTLSTFTDAGWDFVWETANGPNDIWAICEGVSYPKLAWQFLVGDSDNDKNVDFVDFALMGLKWMQSDTHLYCGGSDLTGDEWVDLDDLAILCENWLQGQ
jgi:hypothetical protein